MKFSSSSFELRTLLALAEGLDWDVGALEIRVAFLNADLDEELDPTYLVNPPSLLTKLGLIPTKRLWKLKRVLYGLRSGPKRWGDKRDQELRKATIMLTTEEWLTCHQGVVCKHLWLVKSGERIVARFLVYVDDVIVTGPTEIVVKVLELLKASGIVRYQES